MLRFVLVGDSQWREAQIKQITQVDGFRGIRKLHFNNARSFLDDPVFNGA